MPNKTRTLPPPNPGNRSTAWPCFALTLFLPMLAQATQNNFPGPGYYTQIQNVSSSGYIGFACSDTAGTPAISCGVAPGIAAKGHVLQTGNNPGKTFLIKQAPDNGHGSGFYNIINVTDNRCLAVGDGSYESSGTRVGVASLSAGYLVAIQDAATMPSASCNYANDHVQWQIYDNGAGVDIKTNGYVAAFTNHCWGSSGAMSGTLNGTTLSGSYGDFWVRNGSPTCNSTESRLNFGGFTPLADHILLSQVDSSSIKADGTSTKTITVTSCKNASSAACDIQTYDSQTVSLSNSGVGTLSASSVTLVNGQTTFTITSTSSGVAKLTATPTSSTNGYTCSRSDVSGTQTAGVDSNADCQVQFTSATPGFDAVEVGGAVASPLYTKLSAIQFSFDVLVTSTSGTTTTLNTGSTDTVEVELMDYSVAGTCGSYGDTAKLADVTGTTPYTFTTGSGMDNGRHSFTVTSSSAAKNVRVRMRSGGQTYCSTDNFAIRPQKFNLAISPSGIGNAMVAGSTEFTVTATAYPASGYSGPLSAALTMDKTRVMDWQATPQAIDSTMLNGSFGEWDSANNQAVGTFTYGDFGTISIQGPPASTVYDRSFTAVDQSATRNDCVPGSSSNAAPTTGSDAGKFGCDIGSVAIDPLGVFWPHHYEVNASFSPGNGSFTYMGQPNFGITLEILAKNSGGGTMGRLLSGWSGTPALPTFSVSASNSSTTFSLVSNAGNPFTLPNFVWPSTPTGGIYSGSGTYTFLRPASPIAPYENFKLTVTVTDPSTPPVKITVLNGTTLATPSSSVDSPTTSIRYGRISLPPANGSELLDLQMKMRAEYWQSNLRGWQLNTDDNCTGTAACGGTVKISLINASLSAADTCVLDNGNPGGGASGAGCSAAGTIAARRFANPPVNGDFNLWLKAPGVGKLGGVQVHGDIPTWLGGKVDALASFGIKPGTIIFRRERY